MILRSIALVLGIATACSPPPAAEVSKPAAARVDIDLFSPVSEAARALPDSLAVLSWRVESYDHEGPSTGVTVVTPRGITVQITLVQSFSGPVLTLEGNTRVEQLSKLGFDLQLLIDAEFNKVVHAEIPNPY